MEVKTKKEYPEPLTKEEALEYVRRTLQDGNIKSVHVRWKFDEQQADPFHHFWTSESFIEAIEKIVE